MRRAVFLPLMGLAILALLACGAGAAGGQGGSGLDPNYKPVTNVAVAPPVLSMGFGMQHTFEAAPTGPEASPSAIAWTTNGGTLSTTTGPTSTWTAPAYGSGTTFWVKATSTQNTDASATATITLTGSGGAIDQDSLAAMNPLILQNYFGYLFAMGTASPIYQTFQPTYATLTGVSLYIQITNAQYGDDTVTVKIKNTSGIVIGTITQPMPLAYFKDAYGYYRSQIVYFPLPDVPVTPNETYILALEGTKHTFNWGAINGNKYTRGAGFWNLLLLDNDADFLFRTYGK